MYRILTSNARATRKNGESMTFVAAAFGKTIESTFSLFCNEVYHEGTKKNVHNMRGKLRTFIEIPEYSNFLSRVHVSRPGGYGYPFISIHELVNCGTEL